MELRDDKALSEDNRLPIMEHFSALDDPRRDHGKRHLLPDILVLTVCAVIAGADNFVAIEAVGLAKHDWLRGFLALPSGIPSHDTIRAVLARLDPRQFELAFLDWVTAVFERTDGKVIAIDGKTLRRSYNRRSKCEPLQMVSAWAIANHLTLGQRKVDVSSNEITAILELLAVLDVHECIVTIDAIGCQQDSVKQLIAQDADYVVAVKGNQGSLLREAKQCFAIMDDGTPSAYETEDNAHGRSEYWRYWMVPVPPSSLRPIQ